MKTRFLLIAAVLVAACSDDPAPQDAATAQPAPPPAQQQAASAPADAQQQQQQQPEGQSADMAAAEVADPAQPGDPCDLSGYDMNQMTASQHEELVKRCQQSKQ